MNKSLSKWISIFHIISNLPTLLSPSIGTFFVCLVQSLPLESAFYTVIWVNLTHKNGSALIILSKLYFKYALTRT